MKSSNGDGTVTYRLGTAPNTEDVTVTEGEPTGITRKDVYTASDYFTRLYRGYSNGALKGNGVVPISFPSPPRQSLPAPCSTTMDTTSLTPTWEMA